MRLRVLVSPAGTPRLVTREPFDVLENGVADARWTVGDPSPGVPVNEARAVLLGVLQARAGGPAGHPRRVLVRLPRRLSGPRLHGGRGQPTVVARESWGSAQGWSEAIRWLRGLRRGAPVRAHTIAAIGPDPNPPWMSWEAMYGRRSGLGRTALQRYPARRRSRRGRSRKQLQLEVELGLRVHAVADVSLVEPAPTPDPIAALDFRAQTFGFIGGEPEPVLSAELNVDHDDGFDPGEMLYNSNYIRATAVIAGSDHLATLATGASRCAAAPRLSVIHPDGRSSSWLITDVTVEYLPHRSKNTRVVIHLLGQRGQ